MAWEPIPAAVRMVRQQIAARGIRDTRVLQAMSAVPRDRFVPAESRDRAWDDSALPIGLGQTISQPFIVGLMTEALAPGPSDRVLEVGSGCGYQAAVLSRLAGRVLGVERLPTLLAGAVTLLGELGCDNVSLRVGDGSLGWPEEAPYSRILISAACPAIPRAMLLDQLEDGGIAVLPAGETDDQAVFSLRRRGRRLDATWLCGCRFVPLIGAGGYPG